MQNEIWKDVKGFEYYYLVSNYGRIKSIFYNKNKILKNLIDSRGYEYVALYKNDKKINKRIHQLVAIAFTDYDPIKSNKVIDHIDNCRTNNNINNLQAISQRENSSKDICKINTSSKYIGVNYHKSHKKWRSIIRINGKKLHLGYFNNELDAAIAYNKKLEEYENLNKQL